MASQSRKSGFPEFLGDMQSAEAVRRQLIDVPMAAAQQSVFSSAVELATLLGSLPDAFAASQRRELNRVLKSSDDKDPRVAALQASIEQADALRATARLGQTRVERMAVAVVGGRETLHGFVSGSDLAPLEGLTVRLAEAKNTGQSTLTAKTDTDGYFSIDLGTNASTTRNAGAKSIPTSIARRIADLFVGASADAAAAKAGGLEARVGQVEILKGASVLYRDQMPIALDEGSIYREYVIPDVAPSSASGGRDVPSKPSSTPPRATAQPTRATAQPRRVTAQPRRGAKSAQPKKRK